MPNRLRKLFGRPAITVEYRIVDGEETGGSVCEGPEYEKALKLYREGRGDMFTGYDWWFQPKIVQSRRVTEWKETNKPVFQNKNGKYVSKN